MNLRFFMSADNHRLDSYYKWAGKEEDLYKILGDLEDRLGFER